MYRQNSSTETDAKQAQKSEVDLALTSQEFVVRVNTHRSLHENGAGSWFETCNPKELPERSPYAGVYARMACTFS
eukprot:6474198-Amphidinium_carterae.1